MSTSTLQDSQNSMTAPTLFPAVASPTPRKQIIDFLRRELIGPDPVEPHIQADGEEILLNDSPRQRYGAGILFPQAALVELDDNTVAPDDGREEETVPTGGSLELDQVILGAIPDRRIASEDLEADEFVSMTNAFLPSAIGFTCFVEVPPTGLVAHIRAATYKSETVREIGKDGREYQRVRHLRQPFEAELLIPSGSLLGADLSQSRLNIIDSAGIARSMELRVLSRPTSDSPIKRLLTVALLNTRSSTGNADSNRCFFQVELRLDVVRGEKSGDPVTHSESPQGPFLEYLDSSRDPDEEERSLALLYRHRKTYGIGHGCAAAWNESDRARGRADAIWTDVLPEHKIVPIVPNTVDELPLSMFALSDKGDENSQFRLLESLCIRYSEWIESQRQEINAATFPSKFLEAARKHLSKCEECLLRMQNGIRLLRTDQQVKKAFQLANRAMLEQQLHYLMGTDSSQARPWFGGVNGKPEIAPVCWPDIQNPAGNKGRWYPFQLAFLLMNLQSLAVDTAEERKVVDLIWFPTGGGKTEAYLGLTAFSIILRRMRRPDDAGTSVLMRYTLRLLTAQQFQRAASLICALEKMRREGDIPGATTISIGLWAGGDLTPNKRNDAIKALVALEQDGFDNPFVMTACPWCGAEMGLIDINGRKRVLGYTEDRADHLQGRPRTVLFRCHDPNCDFGGNHLLPMAVIDEDLYAAPPTLLLGTVDKFAMLPWLPDARRFFGDGNDIFPPDLIIQDELHLISGPLGSMVGHYETVITELCSRSNDNGVKIPPKIIASTATISRAAEQCHSLWNCSPERVFQFPPQCLRAGDSFFAYEDEKQEGRVYIGVHASALSSHVTSQVRVMGTLLQAASSMAVGDEKQRDAYWTLIGYYNSLRELGHAATLLHSDIPEFLKAMWQRQGVEKPAPDESGKEPGRDRRRFINSDLELTGRIPSGKVTGYLKRLFTPYPGLNEERPVDVAIATNMISVGVDVPRLGLMAVAGQPKTTSEYIQATSRVGRSKEGPGLVVMIYHTGKPRDRSHYEHFHSYHGALYRAVEPTSVTPFSSPVRDRALHALLVTLFRYLDDTGRTSPSPAPAGEIRDRIEEIIRARVGGVDPDELEATMEQVTGKLDHWQRILPQKYGGFGEIDSLLPLMHPAGSVAAPEWENRSWATPSSMRNVDASCEAIPIASYPRPFKPEANSVQSEPDSTITNSSPDASL